MEHTLSPTEFREIWKRKAVLREVYGDYYGRIADWIGPGPTVEVGSGSGNLKDALPGVISSDIQRSDWIDVVLDGQRMPFASASVGGIVGVDVLHHIEYPRRLLREASRVLVPGGRAVFVEPAITPLSRVFYGLGHPEPMDMRADPLAAGEPDPRRHPFESNQALPTLLAGAHRDRVGAETGLQVVHAEQLSLFAYPLSGGFRRWSLLPSRLVPAVLRAERRLEPHVGRWMGFRLLVVFESTG